MKCFIRFKDDKTGLRFGPYEIFEKEGEEFVLLWHPVIKLSTGQMGKQFEEMPMRDIKKVYEVLLENN